MSNVNIKDRQVGNVIVLDIDGDLRIGGSSEALRKAVSRLLQEGHQQILLNLAGVAYIDSSGLGELIAARNLLDQKSGQIKLMHLTQRVRELMVITKLSTVFEVFENESQALAGFNGYGLDMAQPQPAVVRGAHN